ncbi:MAG: L-serine ammonia-lyase, iron-sulfur-dependent, subunit alpha [Angelakisella sp.]
MMDHNTILEILNSEMVLATGCTEPAAIALTAANAGKQLGIPVEEVVVLASGNMIKNAMAAGIPGTPYTGIDYAAAIGAAAANPERSLEVVSGLPQETYDRATKLVQGHKVSVDLANVTEKLYIDVTVKGGGESARAIISGGHTNVVLLEKNGKVVFEKGAENAAGGGVTPELILKTMTVAKIVEYIENMDTKNPPDIIMQSIEINSAISEEGLAGNYGLNIGKTMQEAINKGELTSSMLTQAVLVTSAGADARMAGAPISVVSNSGSGNQGITATMPVVTVAKWLKSGDDKMIRAVTLSNLIPIYIKAKFGRLSALCGATVAGTGAACGVTYLMGGGLKEISYAIQNMVGNVTGMLCDGAKADCALKIHTCVNAAMQSATMAMHQQRVEATDGIVEEDVENSISNFAELGNSGSVQMDAIILRMMLDKGKRKATV